MNNAIAAAARPRRRCHSSPTRRSSSSAATIDSHASDQHIGGGLDDARARCSDDHLPVVDALGADRSCVERAPLAVDDLAG